MEIINFVSPVVVVLVVFYAITCKVNISIKIGSFRK